MVVKAEMVDVTHCDFCDATDENRLIYKCVHCGKDACSDHLQRVEVLGLGPRLFAYLCEGCQSQAGLVLLPILTRMKFAAEQR